MSKLHDSPRHSRMLRRWYVDEGKNEKTPNCRNCRCSVHRPLSIIIPMKVMLVIPHVSGGGGEKVLSELACNLRADTVVVVFEEKFSYPVRGKVIALNAPINRSSALARAWGFLRRIVLFRRVLRNENPDVVLSFMGEANFINALLSRRPI